MSGWTLFYLFVFFEILLPSLFVGCWLLLGLFIITVLLFGVLSYYAYCLFYLFMVIPNRTVKLYWIGELETSFTRSRRLWSETDSWRSWVKSCYQSDTEAMKKIINYNGYKKVFFFLLCNL